MNPKFKHILRLLDDDSEQLATFAMAELLEENDPRLERVLRLLQETPNPKLRRRIHQLQSAITRRGRRLAFASCLKNPAFPLLDTVIGLHLLWFDNDTAGEVLDQWHELANSVYNDIRPDSFRDLTPFLRKKFLLFDQGAEDLRADSLCFGIVIEDFSAVDYMLCIVAKLLADDNQIRAEIVSSGSDFAIFSDGDLFFPKNNWKGKRSLPDDLKFWSAHELGLLLTAQLYTCAVATDSFRYVYTLGGMLRSCAENVKSLPFPYGNLK